MNEKNISIGQKVGENTSSKPFNPLTLKSFNSNDPLTFKPFNLYPDEARLLLNIALMATGRNRFRSTARLLAALERFRPDDVAIANAKAIALISAQKFAEAVAFIDTEGLPRFPDSAMLRAFKGMALIRMDRLRDAAVPLGEAAGQTKDPAAAKLARDLLKG